MTFKVFSIIFFAISLSFTLQAQVDYSKQRALLKAEINKLTKSNSSDLSFTWFSNNGDLIISHDGTKKLTPASTLKIYTTGAALSLLGSNYRYETFLQYDGVIDNCGVLNGNIFIKGQGDPSLGSERFPGNYSYSQVINKFGDEIKELGITAINGNVIADNSIFLDCLTPYSWPLDDQANYYGAAPNGLSFNENSYKLFFKPGQTVGSKTEIIGTDPEEIPGLLLKNKVTTYYAGSGDRAVIMEDPFNEAKEIVGTIPMGENMFFIKGSLPDPARLVALLLAENLRIKGIEVNGKTSSIYQYEGRIGQSVRNTVYTHYSPRLIDIVTHVNMRSHNLFAETLIVTMGKCYRGIGSLDKGLEVVFEYWASKGINISKANIFDGSGLSPLNKISSDILAKMLFTIKEDSSFTSFLETLPVAGVSGTLKNFGKNTPAEGRVFAKSGSIEYVRSYAGYTQSKSGAYLPFCLIVNNFEGNPLHLKKSLERMMSIMCEIP